MAATPSMTSLTNSAISDRPFVEAQSSGGEVADYFALLKPRVMALVIFTALVGMTVSPSHVNPVIGAISLLMIAVGAGASGCLNMWWDADIDAVMTRTRTRPIPAGRIQPGEALSFGLTLSVGSVLVLGLAAARAAEAGSPPLDVLLRLTGTDLAASPAVKAAVDRALQSYRGQPAFLELVRAFNRTDQAEGLLELAAARADESVGAEAVQRVIDDGGVDFHPRIDRRERRVSQVVNAYGRGAHQHDLVLEGSRRRASVDHVDEGVGRHDAGRAEEVDQHPVCPIERKKQVAYPKLAA